MPSGEQSPDARSHVEASGASAWGRVWKGHVGTGGQRQTRLASAPADFVP